MSVNGVRGTRPLHIELPYSDNSTALILSIAHHRACLIVARFAGEEAWILPQLR